MHRCIETRDTAGAVQSVEFKRVFRTSPLRCMKPLYFAPAAPAQKLWLRRPRAPLSRVTH